MKKTIKIISVIIVVVLLCLSNISEAAYTAEQFGTLAKEKAAATGDGSLTTPTQKVMKAIITVTRTVATGIAVIMLVVLAMKYMIAAPGDRADIKKHAVVYVIGAVVLFASSGILGIILKFAKNIG